MKKTVQPLRSVWHSLLWKEWHEHKWKLAALSTILLAVPIVCLVFEEATLFEALSATLFPYVFLSGLFLAMGIAAGENSRRTMTFLQSLPMPIWKAATAKLLWAAVTVVLPILLVLGFTYAACSWIFLGVDYESCLRRDFSHPDWETGVWFAKTLVMGTLGALSMLVWGAAAGVNQRDEIRAGAVAILVILGWFLLLTQLEKFSTPIGFSTAMSAGPGGLAFASDAVARDRLAEKSASPMLGYWLMGIAGVLSHGCLLGWYLHRFGRPGLPFDHSRRQAIPKEAQATWLAPPRRSKLSAIIWKQARETAPLALAALATIVGLALIFHYQARSRMAIEYHLMSVAGGMGYFLAVVAGIGVFHEDLKPKVESFWRSRPVNVHLWFWVKFMTGLSIISCALGAPVLYACWRLGGELSPGQLNELDIGMIALVLLTLYCSAVMAICLARQPIYAGVFSLSAVLFLPLAAHFFSPWVQSRGWNEQEFLIVVCVLLSGFAVVVAWLAVRFNLGYKG